MERAMTTVTNPSVPPRSEADLGLPGTLKRKVRSVVRAQRLSLAKHQVTVVSSEHYGGELRREVSQAIS
jgi:hypothetical protein